MKRWFLCFQDTDHARYEGDVWSAHSFATEGDRERMMHDLRSDKSVWKNDAVRMFTFEQELPDYLFDKESEDKGK